MIDDRINKKIMKLIGSLFNKLYLMVRDSSSTLFDDIVVVIVPFFFLLLVLHDLYVRTYEIFHLKLFVGFKIFEQVTTYVRTNDYGRN